MNTVGFTKEEAEYFGNIVTQMMRSKEARKMAKPKKEKKPPKMKRAELLRRLLAFMEEVHCDIDLDSEGGILLTELRKVVK